MAAFLPEDIRYAFDHVTQLLKSEDLAAAATMHGAYTFAYGAPTREATDLLTSEFHAAARVHGNGRDPWGHGMQVGTMLRLAQVNLRARANGGDE